MISQLRLFFFLNYNTYQQANQNNKNISTTLHVSDVMRRIIKCPLSTLQYVLCNEFFKLEKNLFQLGYHIRSRYILLSKTL